MKQVFYDWFGLNAWLFTLVNGAHGRTYDNLMLQVMEIGEHEHMIYWVFAIAVFLFGRLGVRHMQGKPLQPGDIRREIALIILLIMGYMFYALIVGVAKTVFAMPRPFMIFDATNGGMHFAGPVPEEADWYAAFPSGHAATMGFLTAALWHRLIKPWMRYAAIALVALICWARVAVGMHFPADVMYGVLIGVFAAWVVKRYVFRMMKIQLPGAKPPQRMAIKNPVTQQSASSS